MSGPRRFVEGAGARYTEGAGAPYRRSPLEAVTHALTRWWDSLPSYQKTWCSCHLIDGTPREAPNEPPCLYCEVRQALSIARNG